MKQTFIYLFFFLPILLEAQSFDTLTVLGEINDLLASSKNNIRSRNYTEALNLTTSAKKMAVDHFGNRDTIYADCLAIEGLIFQRSRKMLEAESAYKACVSIRDSVFGVNYLRSANVLSNLGVLLKDMNRFEEAEKTLLRARDVKGLLLGTDNISYSNVQNFLGLLYREMGRNKEAEEHFLAVKKVRSRLKGRQRVSYAAILNNLGILYRTMGRFEEAEENLLEAKKIRQEIYGTTHRLYAEVINNLANLYSDSRRSDEAENYLLEAKKIQEASKPEGEEVAQILENLGILYRQLGRFEESEQCYQKCIEIWEKTVGETHPTYARSLDNLGALYFHMGLFENSEPLYLKSKSIRAEHLGKESPDYSSSLNNLGALYMVKGQYQIAKPYYSEALNVFGKTIGKESPQYAWILNNLAILFQKMEQLDSAELCLKEAMSIREKILGKDHPDFANTLEDMAILNARKGKWDDALKLELEAELIFKKKFGTAHPRYAQCLKYLAKYYSQLDQLDKAEEHLVQANNIQKEILTKSSRHLSERELGAHTQLFTDDLELVYSLCQTHNQAETQLTKTAFDNSLFYKGFLLHASQQVKNLAQSNSSASKQFEQLIALHRLLADEYVKSEVNRQKIGELEEKTNALEKELAQNVAGLEQTFRQVNWQDVKGKLADDEAAIEFVNYHFWNPEKGDSVMYAALLLRSDWEAPKFIPLFEEKSLDSLFTPYKKRGSDYANDLYGASGRGVDVIDQSLRTLYELIWEPLETELTDIQTIYFSPSGLLHRLNLNAIPVDFDVAVADKFRLVQLNSLRSLVISPEVKIQNDDALLYGGVIYELDSMGFFSANENLSTKFNVASRGKSEQLTFGKDDLPVRQEAWRQLHYTNKEITNLEGSLITGKFNPIVRRGYTATEDFLKGVGHGVISPRLIHLATHGYFYPDPANNPQVIDNGQQEIVFKISDHPMIRSGLILSGGNHTWQGKEAIPGIEDGILTAYEVSQMNLSNTELVVLSACETGLGDIEGNEGVYGLQRAFKIAGVKYIIMSLWEVSDKKTKGLMSDFYEKWLEESMAIPEAFRAAQEESREDDEPYDWAGFILIE